MTEPIRKLAAIVFTDIVGFTKLSAQDEPRALDLLKKQRELLKPIVEEHGGSWLKEIGDGLLLTFNTNIEAVVCSIAIQEAAKSIPELDLRIGIHQGEVVFQDDDVLGDDVNIAARIEPFAAPGGISISGRVNASLERNPEFKTHYLGQPQLKGVSQTVKAYCITSHGLPKTDMSQVSAKLEPEGFQWDVKNTIGIAASMIGLFMLINFMFLRVGFADEEEVPSIAILPLDNKGSSDDEFYAYGISSDLISDVASAGLIRVASLNRIEDLGDISSEKKAEKLDVRYIAEGTLWKRDSIFQLSMELYDTKTEKVVWSERWQKNWIELPQIRDLLAENILEKLKVDHTTEVPSYVSNPEAYEYYLKAAYKYAKRENIDDTEIARGLLKKAIELDDNLIKAKILLGRTYFGVGEYDMAMDIYTPALKQAELNDDKHEIGNSLNNMGIVYFYKGDIDEALDHYEKSLKIREELNDKRGIGSSLNNLGNVYREKGDLDKTLDCHKRSLKINEELSYKRGIAHSLHNIGNVYFDKGDIDTALDYHEKALIIKDEIGNKRGVGISSVNIGSIYNDRGDKDTALDYYEKAVKTFEEIGAKPLKVYGLYGIGLVYQAKGDLDKALDHYEKALKIREELSDKNGIGSSLNDIGNVYYDKGDYKNALEYLEKSLSIQTEIGKKEPGLYTIVYLNLVYKQLNTEYNEKEIHSLIQDTENIEYEINFRLYELLEDNSYLEAAYSQIQTIVDAMNDELKQKFLNYPIPKQIIAEYNKVIS